MVVGHCCESGDILTPQPGNADEVKEISLPKNVEIGDYAIIKGAGAYCSSMCLNNYNSFPESAEVMILEETNEVKIIRKR